MQWSVPSKMMRYQGGNRKDFIRDLANRVSDLLTFSNDCHDPSDGRFCSHGGTQSTYGPRGAPSDIQRKFNGKANIPSRSTFVPSLNSQQKKFLRDKGLPMIKVGDQFLAPPPDSDYAAYRAAQIGIGEMVKNDILKKVIETKEGDFHEGTPRPDGSPRNPRYDYTLSDLPIKIGVTISKQGRVDTIIATHEGLDKEAKKSINALRKQRLPRTEFEKKSKAIATDKRSKALQLMNEWRVDHKLKPVELIEP